MDCPSTTEDTVEGQRDYIEVAQERPFLDAEGFSWGDWCEQAGMPVAPSLFSAP
jgi:hypothetical protein